MLLQEQTFIGVDLSGGMHPCTFAVLDGDCRLVTLSGGEIDAVYEYLTNRKAATVAVNAPAQPSRGLVRKELEKQNLAAGHLRGSDLRMAEYELRQRGIQVSPTPSRVESCAAWIQVGFDFHNKLDEAGFVPHPSEIASYQWLETHPHAAFCTLLNQLPLPKPTLEGRLQRQLALHERGLVIKDPMDFFEEITRHKLLKGVLPMEFIYSAEELDALVAAYTAFLAATQPGEVTKVGNNQEGQIALPVPALLEFYS